MFSPERNPEKAEPPIALSLEQLRSEFERSLKPLIGEPDEISIASEQGNLNYSFDVRGEGSHYRLKLKNESEFEHQITDKLVEAFQKEIVVLRALAGREVVVPKALGDVLEFDATNGNGPFCGLLLTWISGVSAAQAIGDGITAQAQVYRWLGEAGSIIHGVHFDGFGDEVDKNRDFSLSWKDYVGKLFTHVSRVTPSILTKELIAAQEDRVHEIVESQPDRGVLVHSDLHLANALVSASGEEFAGLIDWERSRSSVPEEELARILYENFVLGQHFEPDEITTTLKGSGITPQLAEFLKGYGMTSESYEQNHRVLTESLLSGFCTGFFTRWNLDWREERPDWERPALLARTVSETILGKG